MTSSLSCLQAVSFIAAPVSWKAQGAKEITEASAQHLTNENLKENFTNVKLKERRKVLDLWQSSSKYVLNLKLEGCQDSDSMRIIPDYTKVRNKARGTLQREKPTRRQFTRSPTSALLGRVSSLP
jgi:hypothetical protein